MAIRLFVILAFCSGSWAAEDWKKNVHEAEDDIRRRNSDLTRNLGEILADEDEISDLEISGLVEAKEQEKKKLPRSASVEFYPIIHRGSELKIHPLSSSDEETSSPSIGSRLERDLKEAQSNSDSDDDLYVRDMEEKIRHMAKEHEITTKSKLYDYLARELWKYRQVDERSFSQYAVSVRQLLRALETNICDSVRVIKDLLLTHQDLTIGEFEKKAQPEILRRRVGISDHCAALIFKFYGREFFSRLIQVSSEAKTYAAYAKIEPALTEDLSSEEEYYKCANFYDLDAWFKFQIKTMTIFELFMNDICGLRYGGVNDIRIRLQEVAIDCLKMYFELNLLYLTDWYDTNRSAWSKALSTTGAKNSYTVKMFNDFVETFKSRFCRAKFVEQQITVAESEIDKLVSTYFPKFKESDEKFSKSVSDTLGSVTSSLTSWVSPSSWSSSSWWGSSPNK
jgi:hypothetical protein